MLASVIITTYRRPETLKRAVRSVLRQAPGDGVRLELIVSDDDPAFSALPALAALQPEWPHGVVSKFLKRGAGDGGVAASRNRAIAAAQGDWLVFLDDDDALADGALAALLDAARLGGADFVAGHHVMVLEDARGTELSVHERPLAWSGYPQLLMHNVFPVGSYAIRRECIGVPFDTHLRSLEDWLFLIDNLRLARVAVIPQQVLRVHQVVDGSREHRNEAGGRAQRAGDYARIYALHPAPELAEPRRAVLAALGPVTVDELIGASPRPGEGECTLVTTRQGRFLLCDPDESSQAALRTTGQFKPTGAAVASALARLRPGVVVDIGARIGVFGVDVARALIDRTVICVEPQPMVFMHLCANVVANRLRNVSVRQQAVGAADAALRLEAFGDGVEVSFIKVDVGGAELDVLKTGDSLLRRDKPTLLLAFQRPTGPDERTAKLLQYVIGLGYQALQIDQDCLAYHPDAIAAPAALAALAGLGLRVPGATA